MDITTKDIIKTLPFDQAFKTKLLHEFDSLGGDAKFAIERILWDTYFVIYHLRLQENTQLAFLRAEENEESLDSEFYQRVEEVTQKQMQEELAQNSQTVDLAQARKAMELIVKEIQASKKGHK